ncbi:MAG: phospholipase A [Rhodocyclaceae bacterium]|nr:phospholipase A [Rhodocyclaceae bacterium]
MPVRALCASVLSLLACAGHGERLLSTDRTHVSAGQPLEVMVTESSGAAAALPAQLDARIEIGEQRLRVMLEAVDAQQGAVRRYRFEWPDEVLGLSVLRLADDSPSRALLLAERVGWAAGEDPVVRMSGVVNPPDEASTPEPALSFNEPMYFLLGANGGTSARFQLSFKYRLFDHDGAIVRALPALDGLHFGYTQTSLWDLSSHSAPFRDTSYRPSLFYQWAVPMRPQSRHWLSLRTGLEHESNGREGAQSRSINIAFAQADWRYRLGDGLSHVGLAPRVWGYLEKSDNPDIHRYRGYGELGLRAGRDDGWLAKVKLRRGKAGAGSTQVDLSYPMRQSIFSAVGAFVHLQYFDGEGETLLDYGQSRLPQFRIGVSIVR